MSNTRVYLVDGNTSFSMDIGREKETKEQREIEIIKK